MYVYVHSSSRELFFLVYVATTRLNNRRIYSHLRTKSNN